MGASSAVLEVIAGKAAGMSILVEDELVVGRQAEGAGKLAEDEEISRLHARVTLDGNGFCAVEDLGSTNGTFVNGLRLSAPQTLAEGDTIEVGGTTLIVRELRSAQTQRTAESPTFQPVAAPAVASPEDMHVPPQPDVQVAAPSVAPPEDTGVPPEPEVEVPAPASTTLALRLEVDFSAREARLQLDDTSGPVRLVFDDGAWRTAPSTSTEKGDPA
jgi:predicted component of type VI protein secretion system